MVSGQGCLDEILEGMTAGADDYLVKPLDPDDLQARLIARGPGHVAAPPAGRNSVTSWKRLNHELTTIARRDPLTGLGNRRALQEDLELLEARVTRYGHRYCMALIDVDHFKSYNDTYGHQAGDHVLQTVAAQLKATGPQRRRALSLRRRRVPVHLPRAVDRDAARVAVERMRNGVQRLAILHAANPRGVLTVSAGVAMLDPDETRSASEVLKEADEALYRAKQLGRNRVEHVDRGEVDPGQTAQDQPNGVQLIGQAEYVKPAVFRHPA